MPATVKLIKEVTGVEKVAYAGFSQGTTLAFYALTKEIEETFWADNVSVFIALSPCLVIPSAESNYESFMNHDWKAVDVFPNMLGENFDAEEYCGLTNDGVFCDFLTDMEPYGIASADTRSVLQYT